MVAHTQELRLFANVEVVTQVLRIGCRVQAVNQFLKKFAGTVGGYLVADPDTGFLEKLSAVLYGMEHKGKIIQAEGFLSRKKSTS